MSLFNRVTTSTSATPSLFPTSQAQSTPSPFAPSTPATPAGGLFGGASSQPAASAAPPAGGLFGTPQTPATAPPPPPPAAAGGLFSTPSATPTTSNLFSPAPAATSAPVAGGLFSMPAATTGGPAGGGGGGGGGGLFGASSLFLGGGAGAGAGGTTPAATTATTPAPGGLFGPPAAGSRSLFSPTTAATTPGATTPAAGMGFGGGFAELGSSTPKPGGLMFQPQQQQQQPQQQGQQPQQQQQNTVPAATVDITRLTTTTRFGDCHETVQRDLEELDKHIQSQIATAASLSALFPTHRATVATIPSDTSVLAHKLATTKSFLSADATNLQHAQAHHAADNEAATLSIRCLDLFRLPPAQRSQYFQRADNARLGLGGGGGGGENEVTSNAPMIAYFNKHAESMEKALRVFLESVGEVEASLRSVEMSAGASMGIGGEDMSVLTGGVSGRQDARRLNRTLREFNDALRDVSGRIVDVKDGMRELRAGGKR